MSSRKDLQLSLHYGAKYVQETKDGSDYSGFIDLIGIEGRYDITKDWDIGLQSGILHSWNSASKITLKGFQSVII